MAFVNSIWFSAFLSFFLFQSAFSQNSHPIDPATFAAGFDKPYSDAASLSRQLTAPFLTESDKAEAIFTWIAHHVRYDCNKFHNRSQPEIRAKSKVELEQKIKEWEQKEIEATAKSKKGLCEDYSRLFKAMCDAAGVEAAVIYGNSRDFYKPYRTGHNNPHVWNAVKIDGQWHLLDATWAAGYTDAAVKKFTRRVSAGFFKTPPAWFAQNHLPDDPSWQLLEQPLDKTAFPKQPLINYGQMEYQVEDFSDKALAVQGSGYDREIRLKLKQSPAFFMVANSRSKPIQFSHTKEDGFDIIRFFSRGHSDVVIFGGESEHGKKGWLAQYDL